ncbi:MAG: C40 family peptidase [Gaiellales bacterium]
MRLPIAIAAILLLTAPATAQATIAKVEPHAAQPVAAQVTVGALAVADAMQLRGAPYVWGGSGPDAFDCSGFTAYVYAKLGITLAHSTYAQWDAGTHIPQRDLQPGDLVFFDGLGHVGIYIGGGRFIHAPHTGTAVSVNRLSGSWYGAEYDGAVRLPGTAKATIRAWRSRLTHRRHSERALTGGFATSVSPGW